MRNKAFYLVLVICISAYVLASDALIENNCSILEAVISLAIENVLACATWYFLGKVDRKEDKDEQE